MMNSSSFEMYIANRRLTRSNSTRAFVYHPEFTMFLMYYLNEKGERVYTLAVSTRGSIWQVKYRDTCRENEKFHIQSVMTKFSGMTCIILPITSSEFLFQKRSPDNLPTASAHPARFSPEDSYSRQRLLIKKRFGLLITQKPEPVY